MTQEEIDARVVEAWEKSQRGEKPTDYEEVLLAYAFPPACHACGGNHRKKSLNVREAK